MILMDLGTFFSKSEREAEYRNENLSRSLRRFVFLLQQQPKKKEKIKDLLQTFGYPIELADNTTYQAELN